jgi:hypothetical protein
MHKKTQISITVINLDLEKKSITNDMSKSKGNDESQRGSSIKLKNLSRKHRKSKDDAHEQGSPSSRKTSKAADEDQAPSRATTLFYKCLNILDFNLKFKSIDLENVFLKSYLSVTRLIFIKYLFYLILFTLSWLAYLFFHALVPSQGTGVLLDKSCDAEKYGVVAAGKSQANATSLLHASSMDSRFRGDLYLFVCLPVMALIYLVVFVTLLVIELNERKYRNIEEKLQQEEIETKVDVKIAETDLKLAMRKIVEKEADFVNVREVLVQKNKDISTLRHIYLKLAYFLALFVVLLMFVLTFIIFAFEKTTSISKVI